MVKDKNIEHVFQHIIELIEAENLPDVSKIILVKRAIANFLESYNE